MKKLNILSKLIPLVAMAGTTVPLVTITGCNNSGQNASSYSVSYGSTPAGLTWGIKESSVAKGKDFSVSYSLDPGYTLATTSCVIKSGDTTITSSCKFTSTSLTIPASKITGNISITLATAKSANTYTITYNTPSGLTWTTQPTKVVEKTGVSAEYKLTAGYLINTTASSITVGGTEIKSQITYDNGSINIPSNLVTGNIVITLVTSPAPTYDVSYDKTVGGLTWDGNNPTKATQGVVFSAAFSLTGGYLIDTDNCFIWAGGNNITQYTTFSNGTVIIPGQYITAAISITLATKQETDDHDYTEPVGGTIKDKTSATTGVTTYTLAADSANGEMSITLSKTWLNSCIKIASAGTYNITLNDCVFCNSASSDATAEAPINITKKAKGAIVNLILPNNSESSINDRRLSSIAYDDDFVIRHNSEDGTGSLNIKGNGVLNINNVNSNKGTIAKAIQTKTDMTICDGATVNAFAYDTCIQVGGKLTINNANVIADSYNDDAIKNKALDPDADLAHASGTPNIERDIVVKGNSTVTAYAARNGISAAHDFISEGTATVNVFTGYANAGSKVRNNDKLDEQNMYIAIPSSYFSYDDIEKYYFTIDFYQTSSSTEILSTEYMTLKKIRRDNQYYFFKCDRPLDATYGAFKINMYPINQFGAATPVAKATSAMKSISNPAYTNTNDCLTVTSISSTIISTSTSTFDTNYNKLKEGGAGPGGGSSIDTTIPSKGIKAKNAVQLSAGNITLKTVDTCISAGYGEIFSNSATAGDVTFGTGDVTITGAAVNGASTSADGIKAYGEMNVIGGTTTITKSIEALEAGVINIKGGIIKLSASDDGMNASQTGKYNTSMISINISGGVLDVQTTSTNDTDALDSNNTMSITGGLIIARVPGSNPSSAVDCETKSISMSGATLICLGTVEPTISGPSQTTLSGVSSKGSHKVTYYTSSSSTSTYTFTNDVAMNSSCKVYYNYKAPTIA